MEIREEPIRCTKLVLPSTENAVENFAPCLQFFLAQQAEEFIEVLQTKHLYDSFVLDRMKRCLVRVPKVVMNESAALIYLADKIGSDSTFRKSALSIEQSWQLGWLQAEEDYLRGCYLISHSVTHEVLLSLRNDDMVRVRATE